MPTSADRSAGRMTNSGKFLCYVNRLLCMGLLGVWLIALGIWFIVRRVELVEAAVNGSTSSRGDINRNEKGSALPIGILFILCGIIILLPALRSVSARLHSEQQRRPEAQNPGGDGAQQERETPEEQAQRNSLPTYEEAVGNGQYPVRQSNLRPSTSQLPAYKDLFQVDHVQYEAEGSEASTNSQPLLG